MTKKEKELLTRAYAVHNRLMENLPFNPADFQQKARALEAFEKASRPLSSAMLEIRDGDLQEAEWSIEAAEELANRGRRTQEVGE